MKLILKDSDNTVYGHGSDYRALRQRCAAVPLCLTPLLSQVANHIFLSPLFAAFTAAMLLAIRLT